MFVAEIILIECAPRPFDQSFLLIITFTGTNMFREVVKLMEYNVYLTCENRIRKKKYFVVRTPNEFEFWVLLSILHTIFLLYFCSGVGTHTATN